jgi:predicted GTPase
MEDFKIMKPPKQLRTEINSLRANVSSIVKALRHRVHETKDPAWGVGLECEKTAGILDSLLSTQLVPDYFKVAVVGRFKAGKSSFVNELLGLRLASEDTSPETAAVTTFRYGATVKATIRFVSTDAWEALRRLHQDDPKHINAHRMKMWESFSGKTRKNSDGVTLETFDLSTLEKNYVKEGGHSIEIALSKMEDKPAESVFRRKLKEFTSGTRPHHCLIEKIEITSPSPLLDEGVLLIDTPGLDDTERYRVTLTEKAVEDVDAILFLTQSGVAYGQSEKDFMLTLLRRGTVKQLIFVITQVDKTHDQHLAASEDNDEEPESITQRIKREDQRIRQEINATLDELGDQNSPSMIRYREQLGDVGLVFTSVRKHRDWKDGKKITHSIYDNDPGGIERIEAHLLRLLSTESRLALVAHNIAFGAKSALDELSGIVVNRHAALSNIKDGEVAEQRLARFRDNFEFARERFQNAAESDVAVLRKNIEDSNKRNAHLIETIGLLADRELGEFETRDVGKHWKTRRSGYWGYMDDLQKRVANKIFPRVQQLLSGMTDDFSTFIEHFEKHLFSLSATSKELAEEHDLGSTLSLDLTNTLAGSLEKSLATANDLIVTEEQRIISFLDDFVSDEVSDKISDVRSKVADIFGTGTTYHQSHEVRDFYSVVRRLLQESLTEHIRDRSIAFGEFLALEADGVPRNAIAEVQATLAGAQQDIRAATMLQIGGEREIFETQCSELTEYLLEATKFCLPLLNTSSETLPEVLEVPLAISISEMHYSVSSGTKWYEEIQKKATNMLSRVQLADGDVGWPFEKIFKKDILSGSLRVALIDPYLAGHHQIRNLKEFLLIVAEAIKPKEILVITSGTWNEGSVTNNHVMDEVGSELFRNFGTILTIKIELTIHDRYVVFDNGLLIKLGRGLDIYKPAIGLASHRPASRRVRRTDIDIFSTNEMTRP